MPTTFRTHFNDDITRAENILARSRAMQGAGEPERLYKDLRLSSVALAVGAQVPVEFSTKPLEQAQL